jgi:hypothetical protein
MANSTRDTSIQHSAAMTTTGSRDPMIWNQPTRSRRAESGETDACCDACETEADRVVRELVARYMECSTSMSGIFCL